MAAGRFAHLHIPMAVREMQQESLTIGAYHDGSCTIHRAERRREILSPDDWRRGEDASQGEKSGALPSIPEAYRNPASGFRVQCCLSVPPDWVSKDH